jgi:predicted nucleic acid-binding protein
MPAIVDTGPLVAFFDKAERHHVWVNQQIDKLDAPLLVCEPVIAETMYLLSRFPTAKETLFELLQNGALKIAFHLERDIEAVRGLVTKYSDVPMALADACIVRMAEIHRGHAVLTLDSDFLIYRKTGGGPLDVLHPTTR